MSLKQTRRNHDLQNLLEVYGKIDTGLTANDLIEEARYTIRKLAQDGALFIEGDAGTGHHWGRTFDNVKFSFNRRFDDIQLITLPPDNDLYLSLKPPVEIQESLERFKSEYPETNRAAFIMMQFGVTRAHLAIVDAIQKSLSSFGIVGVRADGKDYHDDLFYNVLTYIYGCGFGVAVFERIEAEVFNPNVSLEVGYMLALRKPVCLLKDRTLRGLHTDVVGRLYKSFDPQDPLGTIPDEISHWLADRKIV